MNEVIRGRVVAEIILPGGQKRNGVYVNYEITDEADLDSIALKAASMALRPLDELKRDDFSQPSIEISKKTKEGDSRKYKVLRNPEAEGGDVEVLTVLLNILRK